VGGVYGAEDRFLPEQERFMPTNITIVLNEIGAIHLIVWALGHFLLKGRQAGRSKSCKF